MREIMANFPGEVLVEIILTPMHILRGQVYWHNASLVHTECGRVRVVKSESTLGE